MDSKTNLSLTLYENLLSIDSDVKKLFNVDLNNKITKDFKRGIIDLFEQKLSNADLNYEKVNNLNIITNLYLECMTIYSKNFLEKIEYIKDVPLSLEDQDSIKHFNGLVNNILYNNLKEVEKDLDLLESNHSNDCERSR